MTARRNANVSHRGVRGRTGLRNKLRGGRGTYSVKGKRKFADSYGTWKEGRMIGA